MGMFSTHVAQDLDAKSGKLSAGRTVQGRWRFMQVKNNTF